MMTRDARTLACFPRGLVVTIALAGALSACRAAPPAWVWPQFRGPDGGGVLEDAAPPLDWSTTANVAWSVEIPGRGWSSPVVWGDQVFVTSAINPDAFKPPSPGIFGTD